MTATTAASRTATLIVARRLDRMQSGDNAFLRAYLKVCREAGLSIRLVFAPRRSFGNVAWARLAPEIETLVADVDWAQTIRIRGMWISTAPSVWTRCLLRFGSEVWRRLAKRRGSRYPSLLGAELSVTEALDTVARAQQCTSEVVIVEYSSLAPLLKSFDSCKRVVFLHDLFSLRAASFVSRGLAPDHVQMSIEHEARRCEAADLLIHASCIERDRLRTYMPQAEHEWMRPAVHLVAPLTNDAKAPHAVFLGSVHAGNTEALRFLRDNIWPKVRLEIPQARLFVAGSIAATIPAHEAEREGLHLLGVVDDLASLGGEQSIGLAPLRVGSGIPIKVVDYLSLGMPVVVTHGAIDAFGDSLDGLVAEAETDGEFIEIICNLIRNESKRHEMSRNAAAVRLRLENSLLLAAMKR